MKLRGLWIALVIASPLSTQAAEAAGYFIDGSIGNASNQYGTPNSRVATLDIGYRWSWFGLDAGYVDFDKTGYSYTTTPNEASGPSIRNTFGAKQKGYTFDASGRWNIGDHFYYGVRAGLYAWHEAFYYTASEPLPIRIKTTDSGTSWNAGLNAGYDFSDHFSLGLRYDWYRTDNQTTHPLSVNAEFRF